MPYSSQQIFQAAHALNQISQSSALKEGLQPYLQTNDENAADAVVELIEQYPEEEACFDAFLEQTATADHTRGLATAEMFKDLPNPEPFPRLDMATAHQFMYCCPNQDGCTDPDCRFYRTRGHWVNLFSEPTPHCPQCNEPLQKL